MKKYVSSLGYSVSSLATTIINKYILSVLHYNNPFLLVVLQSALICLFLACFCLTNSFKLRFKNIKRWLVPSLFLNIMIFTGTKTLQYLPISLFMLFKNGNIIIVSLAEYFIFSRPISSLESISFLLMIFSSYLGDVSDKIETVGYIWTVLNILSTTVYLVSLRYVINIQNSSTVESIFFPNLMAIPLVGIISAVFEHHNYLTHDLHLILSIIASSICALVTALTTSLVLKYLSSTTFSMIGAFNKILMGFSGLVFLNEEINTLKIISLLLGSLSTLLYINSLRYKKII